MYRSVDVLKTDVVESLPSCLTDIAFTKSSWDEALDSVCTRSFSKSY